MKKIIALVLALITCFTLAFSVLAEDYQIGSDGNAVYNSAVGYVFTIEDVNGVVTGEDATIVTDNAALTASKSTWAIWFHAQKVKENVYVALTDGAAMGGTMPSVNMKADEIIVIVHSASSNPNDAATYPNWEDKVAALAVKTGDYLVLGGIDIATGNCTNGTVTVATKEDVDNGTVSVPEGTASEPATESSAVIEESSESAVSSEPSAPSAPSAPESDSEIKSSTMKIKNQWLAKWGWIIWLVVGIVAFAAVVIFVVVRVKANKAEAKKEEPKEDERPM